MKDDRYYLELAFVEAEMDMTFDLSRGKEYKVSQVNEE